MTDEDLRIELYRLIVSVAAERQIAWSDAVDLIRP